MNFFLEKQLFSQNKIFMYLLVPFILQNFKKTLWADSQDVPFLGLKWPISHKQIFFGANHYYCFDPPIGPFHCAKFTTFFTADPDFGGCAIFGPKMVHLPQTNIFWKIVNIILIYLLAPFIAQNLKKILPVDSEL